MNLKNLFFKNTYSKVDDAVIITCYFNPTKSPYRTKALHKFLKSIEHLNHIVVECSVKGSEFEVENKNTKTRTVIQVQSDSLLWHKEALINLAIKSLPNKYNYIFWIDADVIFTNNNWLVDSVNALKTKYTIIQPFEYCFHLEQDKEVPSHNTEETKLQINVTGTGNVNGVWKSFGSNCADVYKSNETTNYHKHGHVGFAWGIRRNILNLCFDDILLYDKALSGGADHIMAHAAAGHIPHNCIDKAFSDDLEDIYKWSNRFYDFTLGHVGFIKGDLYHIWHGEIEKRKYLNRIQQFTPMSKQISKKDKNGLYISSNKNQDDFMINYFLSREITDLTLNDFGMNEHIEQNELQSGFGEFGGGEFGGAGASGEFDTEPLTNNTTNNDMTLSNDETYS